MTRRREIKSKKKRKGPVVRVGKQVTSICYDCITLALVKFAMLNVPEVNRSCELIQQLSLGRRQLGLYQDIFNPQETFISLKNDFGSNPAYSSLVDPKVSPFTGASNPCFSHCYGQDPVVIQLLP